MYSVRMSCYAFYFTAHHQATYGEKKHTSKGSDKMCAVSEVIKITNMYLMLKKACDL